MKKRFFEFVWPIIGIAAVVAAIFLLYRQFQGEAESARKSGPQFALPPSQFILAMLTTPHRLSTLTWYDRIALLHLGVSASSWTRALLIHDLCART